LLLLMLKQLEANAPVQVTAVQIRAQYKLGESEEPRTSGFRSSFAVAVRLIVLILWIPLCRLQLLPDREERGKLPT